MKGAVFIVKHTRRLLFMLLLFGALALAFTAQAASGKMNGTVLTITGSGGTGNFDGLNPPSWAQYADTATEIIVSEKITSIGTMAFKDFTKVTKVTLPDTLTSIGAYAFINCGKLEEINIPNNVTEIKSSAFSDCASLKTITLPDGLTAIPNNCFCRCGNLTQISIPSSLRTVGVSAFQDCRKLGLIIFRGAAADWRIEVDNTGFNNVPFTSCEVQFTGGTSTYPMCGPDLYWEIDGGTLFIWGDGEMDDYTASSPAPWASRAGAITGIELVEGVTHIGDYAFRNISCASVSFPHTLSSIGQYAFYGNKKLASVSLPNSLLDIGAYAFASCTALKSADLPDGLTVLNEGAFCNCSALSKATLPNGLQFIGADAFAGCAGTLKVTYEGTREEFEQIIGYANIDSSRLTFAQSSAQACGTNAYWTFKDGTLSITGTGAINDYAQYEAPWAGLPFTRLTIASGITAIGDYAFSDSYSLTSVSLPESLKTIGFAAFFGCGKLSDISIPSRVSSIGAWAFARCMDLTDITVPASVTSLGERAFSDCNGLERVRILAKLTAVPDYAFYLCTSLTEITLPSSVTGIGAYAFDGCYALPAFTLPASLKSIGEYAFGFCYALKTVSGSPKAFTPAETAFFGCNALENYPSWLLPVRGSCGDRLSWSYQGGVLTITGSGEMGSFFYLNGGFFAPWHAYRNEITEVRLPQGLTNIGRGAFGELSGLTEITLPQGITKIEDHAFAYCAGLTSVTVPASVSVIYADAFTGCTGLTDIYLTGNTNMIPRIYNCPSLREVHVPASNTYLSFRDGMLMNREQTILYRCMEAASGALVIPEGVTEIYNVAFDGCVHLTSVTFPSTWTAKTDEYNPDRLSVQDIYLPSHVQVRCYPNSLADDYFAMHGTNPVSYLTSGSVLRIPAAQSIGQEAFEGTGFARVVLPDGVTAIESLAFAYMPNLKTLVLPASVTRIAPNAFEGTGLETVVPLSGYLPDALKLPGVRMLYIYDPSVNE